MVEDKPRYLLKIKGCYYWRPTKRMRAFGFKLQCLGKNDVPAKQAAIAWNDKWDRVRKGDAVSFDDTTVIYPEGTIGEAYQRIMNLRKAARESKGAVWTTEQSSRDDWPRAWRWIGPVFGDLKPCQVEPGMLIGTDPKSLGLRPRVALRVSQSEAHRVIKVWRLLWNRMSVLGYCDADRDPSFTFQNSSPDPRNQIWYEGEVVRLVKEAWRGGYKGLAVCIAVAWDSQLSPVEARHLTLGQRRYHNGGSYFAVDRAKTGKAAVATLSRRAEKLLHAYLNQLKTQKVELLDTAPIFRTRGAAPVR